MRKHHRLAITSLGMGIAEFGDVAYVVSLAASPYLSGPRSAIHVSPRPPTEWEVLAGS